MNPSHLDTALHIPRCNLCQIAHVVHDLTIVQYLDFQLSVAEIHDMAKIVGVAVLFAAERAGDIVGDGRHFQNKLGLLIYPF